MSFISGSPLPVHPILGPCPVLTLTLVQSHLHLCSLRCLVTLSYIYARLTHLCSTRTLTWVTVDVSFLLIHSHGGLLLLCGASWPSASLRLLHTLHLSAGPGEEYWGVIACMQTCIRSAGGCLFLSLVCAGISAISAIPSSVGCLHFSRGRMIAAWAGLFYKCTLAQYPILITHAHIILHLSTPPLTHDVRA